VLELVDGETLAETIAAFPRGLPISDVRAIARQVAEALDAAHEKGIVHRDLKPANIKITPDGVVKVLDFGVAKAGSADDSHPDLSESRAGVILGTAAYMSPEQARGHTVDKRGDIWAFGCVLYEMLTGRLAFPGVTISDRIAKILEREPDWSALPVSTPSALRRVLFRCLTKDPKQRLRDIGDVRLEIDAVDDAPQVKTSTPWLPWLAAAAMVGAIGAWATTRQGTGMEDPFANAQFTRFTDWPGTEGLAEISPDGKFVAFMADKAGEFDLWVSQVGTSRFVNLTEDLPPMGASRSDSLLRTLGFSGDGAEIWFSPTNDPGERKMIMPLTGGTPRAFLGEGDVAASWSPDGTHLAYFNNRKGDPLFVADRTGRDAREIPVPQDDVSQKGLHNHNPVWSADGEWIYFVHGVDPTAETDVWRVRPTGGSPERLTQQNSKVNFVAPLDSRTVLYVARPQDLAGPSLWTLDVASKTTRRVISGLEQYTSVAASRDGRRVVATIANPSATLWQVPLLDRLADDRDVQPYALPTMRALAPRFAGASLFFLSSQGPGDGLWRFEDGQTSEVWKSRDGPLSEPPAVSIDGRRVAVVARQDGKRRLVMMSADGTNSRTLAPSLDIQGAANQSPADWSPDGAWIAAGGSDAQGAGLFKIPVDGGAPVRIVSGQATNPIWSPDGSVIVYSGALVAGQVALLGVRPDGADAHLPQILLRAGAYRFRSSGARLVYMPRLQWRDFWELDFATGKTRQLTRIIEHSVVRTFDITPDGKHIVFDRLTENSDIVLIDLPKP
ncbi:MAG: protein kinase, partial [Vicinamibacterales bacterium]